MKTSHRPSRQHSDPQRYAGQQHGMQRHRQHETDDRRAKQQDAQAPDCVFALQDGASALEQSGVGIG